MWIAYDKNKGRVRTVDGMTYSWQGPKSPLRLRGWVFPTRKDIIWNKMIYAQSPTRSLWKEGNSVQSHENERPTRSSCKCMWKLSIKAGESIYRKAAECKSNDRDSLFAFFASLLVRCKVFPLK